MIGLLEFQILHYAVWPLLLVCLCRWAFGPVGRLSFGWVFLLTWLLLIHAQAAEIFVERYRHFGFIAAVWGTPAVVLLVAGPLLRGLGHEIPQLSGLSRRTAPTDRDRVVVMATPFLTAALWMLITLYVIDIGVRNVALFFLFANPGSLVESMQLRISGLTSNLSPVLSALYGYSRALFIPLYAAVATGLLFRGAIGRAHWGLVLLGSAVFSLLTAAKAPLAYTLAAVALTAFLSRPRQFGLARIGLLGGVVLMLPALVYPLLSGDRGWQAVEVAVSNMWRRVTYVTSETGAMHFDAFPALHAYQGAGSNRILAAAANVPFERTPNYIYDRYLDEGIIHGGTVNTAFYAAFYADWGEVGVVAGAILVGFTLLGLQLFFDRRRGHDATTVGVRAATLVAVAQLMSSDYYGVALGRGLLSMPLMLWVFDLVVATVNRGARQGLPSPGQTPATEVT